jgi:hypothetical protein
MGLISDVAGIGSTIINGIDDGLAFVGHTVQDLLSNYGGGVNIATYLRQREDPSYNIRELPPIIKNSLRTPLEDVNVKSNGAPIVTYPLNNASAHKFGIQILNYRRPDPITDRITDIEADIFLPVPANLSETYGVQLQDLAMTPLGGAAASALAQSVQGMQGSGGLNPATIMPNLAGSIGRGLTRGGVADSAAGAGIYGATKLVGALGDMINSGEIAEGAAEQALGSAPNPNMSVLFKGVNLREHNFSWRLYPRNEEESLVVKRIISYLRKAMLPDTLGGYSFVYPKMFKIEVFPSTEYSYKFKTCMLESMEANYAPTSPSFHANKAPSEINLSLKFQELEYFTARDFDENGDFIVNGESVRISRTGIAGDNYRNGR